MAQNFSELFLSLRRELRDAGVESADLDAREILCAVTGKSREKLIQDYGFYAAEETIESAYSLVQRRLQGEPLAYLIGKWDFFGMELEITPDVLVPREDTAVLAQAAIDAVREWGPGARVMDLCTGSGCVGLAVAKNVPECRCVVLADISNRALAVARSNLRGVHPSCSVSCVCADVKRPPAASLGTFHVITCNPPYIPSGEIDSLDASVCQYEPRIALDGGADGLEFYRLIPAMWKKALKPGGWLLMECGWNQADEVAELMRKNGYEMIQYYKDTLGHNRGVAGTWSNIAHQ